MIEDTILEKLRWQQFDNNESYRIAKQKYNDILFYVFPVAIAKHNDADTTNFTVEKDGIKINNWWGQNCCCRGINLNFWDNFENRTCFRCLEFKGTAKDFKTKVLEKFETLKSLKQKADEKYISRKCQKVADELEITELTEIAKRAFDKYEVNISKNMAGYRLTLEIDFSDKRELLNFCIRRNK